MSFGTTRFLTLPPVGLDFALTFALLSLDFALTLISFGLGKAG